MINTLFRTLLLLPFLAAFQSQAQDTLYFDLSQLTLGYTNGQQEVGIPVYFNGNNSSVNAIDFWFQFNTAKYTYQGTTADQVEADFLTHYNAEIDYLSSTISTSQNDVFLTAETPFLTLTFTLNNPCDEVLASDFTSASGLINGEVVTTLWTTPNSPTIGINITTPQPWCLGEDVAFSFPSAINSQNITDYTWSAGASSGVGSEFTTSYNAAGTFGAEVAITTEAGCMANYAIELSIQPGPNVSFDWTGSVAAEPVTFNNTTTFLEGNISSYDWTFGDGATSSVENPVYTYSNAGNFDITLTAAGDNGCSTSLTQTISITSDITEKNRMERKLYPNPASEQCIVYGANLDEIRVFSNTGQLMLVPIQNMTNGRVTIALEGLSSGLYYIHTGEQVHPLVVQ